MLTDNWDAKFTLPFANGSNLQSNIAGTLGKGTELAFTVKTIANLWNKNDELVIVPRLRYVSPSGAQYDYDDTKIYYFAGTGNEFVEVGSDRDLGVDICSTMLPPTKLTFPQFNGSYNRDEIARTLPLFNRINETGYDESYVITNSGKQSFVGVNSVLTNDGFGTKNYLNVGHITIPSFLKLYTGDEEDMSYNMNNEGANVIRLDDSTRHVNTGNSSFATILSSNGAQVANNTKELMYASMQTWYGEWVMPTEVYIAFTSDVEQYGDVNHDGVVTLNDYAEYKWSHGETFSTDEPIWLKEGYLVLNFEIYVRKNGVDHLTYYSNTGTFNRGAETVHGQNMMRVENAKASYNETVYVGGRDAVPVVLQTGDIAIFDMRDSTLDSV